MRDSGSERVYLVFCRVSTGVVKFVTVDLFFSVSALCLTPGRTHIKNANARSCGSPTAHILRMLVDSIYDTHMGLWSRNLSCPGSDTRS